jgi:mannose-6-phosphate isomerase-like protein (cupin superfamily)
MTDFATKMLPRDPDVLAPDGSEVRILLATGQGSMAHFRLAPGRVSRAIVHRTVDEIWFVLAGRGEMWRARDGRKEVTELSVGLSLTIPAGTEFQFRAGPGEPLQAVAITMPPWPGDSEAVFVPGCWTATV